MTDSSDLDTLREIVALLDQANQRVKELERWRDEEVARAVDRRAPVVRTGRSTRSRGHLTEVAEAASLSRQRVYVIVQTHERAANLAGQDQPPQS